MRNKLPNILSSLRIVLSLFLLFLIPYPYLFTAIYLLSGITDILDSYLARKLDVQSELGAKLDSLGDLVFWIVVFILFFTSKIIYSSLFVGGFGVIVLFRIVNFLVTKIKFNQFGMIHTWGNKITGLILFFLIPVWLLTKSTPLISVVFIFIIALLSCIDELLILLYTKEYNRNTASYYIIKKRSVE